MKLTHQGVTEHSEAVKTVMQAQNLGTVETQPGDVFNLTYSFTCDYFGAVEQCLRAVASIVRDPSVVVDVSLAEVNHGEILLLSVVDALRELKRNLDARSAKPVKKPSMWQRLISRWQP